VVRSFGVEEYRLKNPIIVDDGSTVQLVETIIAIITTTAGTIIYINAQDAKIRAEVEEQLEKARIELREEAKVLEHEVKTEKEKNERRLDDMMENRIRKEDVARIEARLQVLGERTHTFIGQINSLTLNMEILVKDIEERKRDDK
jgi:N12 class adenine-specific DNA methylase